MKAVIKTKIQGQATEVLKVIAKQLMTNYSEGAIIVFSEVLDELELRMSEEEFMIFTDNL
jgi:hypothetical protein